MEGIRKRGGQYKRWRDDEAEEGLTILGIKNRQPAVTDRHHWRKIVLEGLLHSGLQCLRRRSSSSSSIGGSSSGSDGSSFRGGCDVSRLSSGSSCFSSGGGGGTTASVV